MAVTSPEPTTVRMAASYLANEGAKLIEEGYEAHMREFRALTRRASVRFAERDWTGGLRDATHRLGLYGSRIRKLVERLEALQGDRFQDRLVWAATKAVYSGLIAGRYDCELAETFYNSVTRKVFSTVGVDPDIEFLDTDFTAAPSSPGRPVFSVHPAREDLSEMISAILGQTGPPGEYRDLTTSARRVAHHLRSTLPGTFGVAEVLDAVFYRRKGAYLVGRIEVDGEWKPLVLALLNGDQGIIVDAVLTEADAVSILFSFTRSHFHVDLAPAHEMVRFLSSLMPLKRIAELYIAIGHHKHGKTLLYKALISHLETTTDRFARAPGTPGLVMVTFTMPGFEFVFKVIRDRFPPEKQITRNQVREKYRIVFRHDRAGRLVEAQEFEHLRFHRRRFDPDLLEELLGAASRNVRIDGESVVVDHCYVERRVTPLDLYVQQEDEEAGRLAVIDYGAAIGELARTGVFPGDLLLKNFGVTRHGRVVFYDYDELTLLEEVNFRDMPVSADIEDDMAEQPWFGVGVDDVFPEELRSFLGLSGPLRAAFEAQNDDLFTARSWRELQSRLAAGEIIDIRPYLDRFRLPAEI